MEEQIDSLNYGFPPKYRIVEVIDSYSNISLQNVFLESVRFAQIYIIDVYLKDWYEDVPPWVYQIEGDCLNFQVQTLKTARFSLFKRIELKGWLLSGFAIQIVDVFTFLTYLVKYFCH